MLFFKGSNAEKKLAQTIKRNFGISPRNIELYTKAFTHRSVLGEDPEKNSNERLEYLGDAVLDSIVAEYLFNKFPRNDEGSLTRMKSRIVSRKNLSRIAMKLGLEEYVDFRDRRRISIETITGNALEALIGAMFLDRGYKKTRRAVLDRMITPYVDLNEIQENTIDPKSELIIWAQRRRKPVVFREDEEIDRVHYKEYVVTLMVDGKEVATGKGRSKKKAEQDAAKKGLGKIGD